MTKDELLKWYKWYRQYTNGYHMSSWDWMQFIQLNHIVMDEVHRVHNDNMTDKSNPNTFVSK